MASPAPVAASAQPTPAIVVKDLEKTYPNGTRAVQGISFYVRAGEIYGILGPNGAGKSTAIGVLGTLVRPTGGQAFVLGLDVTRHQKTIRRTIGFAMQDAGVDELATGREFLTLQGRLFGIAPETIAKRTATLLRLFELDGAADKRIKSYSGGMRRRIDLASALIHYPKILFLDEPTEGLDPRSRVTMWKTLQRLRQQLGTTILLSTHYMEEADHLCDRLAIVDQGRIVVEGTPAELKASVGGQSVTVTFDDATPTKLAAAEAALGRLKPAPRIHRASDHLICYVAQAAAAVPNILRTLDASRLSPRTIQANAPALDDVYLKYTGRTLAVAEAKKE